MADLIPGVNVGNLIKQYLNPNQDLDVFDNISVRGGKRSPANGALIGAQQKDGAAVKPASASKPAAAAAVAAPTDLSGVSYGGGDGGVDMGLVNSLRGDITGRGRDIDAIYSALFGDLTNLVKSRAGDLETQYGDQLKKAADQYAGALPEIENSYAAIGAADSTDTSDAKTKAKAGYEDTTKTIGKNKADDIAKLGQYDMEQRAKIQADKDAAARNVARAGETTDTDALRSMRNDLETNLDQAGVTRAQLGTNGQAAQTVSGLTGDAGRFEQATNALDSIIKSSMSGAVKEAAVKAITDNAGLSDEEKNKVNQMYGNVYAEQQAL